MDNDVLPDNLKMLEELASVMTQPLSWLIIDHEGLGGHNNCFEIFQWVDGEGIVIGASSEKVEFLKSCRIQSLFYVESFTI